MLMRQGTWRCVGAESGTKFDEVELSNDEPEWTEFDEKVRTSFPYYHLQQRRCCATAPLSTDEYMSLKADFHADTRPQANAGVSIMEFESKIERA